MNEKIRKQLEFLIEVDKMKNILRQTLLMDKSRRENDAEHSWHFAVMALTLFEYSSNPDVDINRVIKMALLHDLVEVYAGDTFAYDKKGNEDKAKREKQAADRLFSILPPEQACEFRALWEEFDSMETPDAVYASAIDRLQPFISHTWVLHGITKDMVLDRMKIVKTAMQELWEFVEQVIDDSVAKGQIKQ